MTIQSDALLSVTGIIPRNISARDLQHAATVPATWERRLARWLDAEQEPFDYVAPPDLDKWWMQLATPPSKDDLTAWLTAAGDNLGLGLDYYTGLMRARNYLISSWPKLYVDTMAGPQMLPLSVDDAHEIWSLIQVLDDPDRVITEMNSRTLTSSQADAFRICYPSLYDHANRAIDAAIARKLAKRHDWSPGWEWEAVLSTLRGVFPEQSPPPPPEPAITISEHAPNISARHETQVQVSSKPKRGRG